MTAARCLRPSCRGFVHIDTDGQGRVVSVCVQCERKRRGLCRDCPQRTPNSRAIRCAACARSRHLALDREQDRERYAKRRKEVLAHHRRRAAIPAIREHRRRYMDAYRASHPRDGLDRAYQRAYMAARRADPTYRAQQNARKRELRALERAA